MASDVVDLFAGAGGWSVALRELGLTEIGVDDDYWACETALVNGFSRYPHDIRSLDGMFPMNRFTGLVASPPCGDLSLAGPMTGRDDLHLVLTTLNDVLGETISIPDAITILAGNAYSDLTELLLQPLLWLSNSDFRWTAWEQVPAALPIWAMCEYILQAWGWHTWAGLVRAEEYGVPQTRTRAILLASKDKKVYRPTTTHSRYHRLEPRKVDLDYPRWVSMGEALQRAPASILTSSYGNGGMKEKRGVRMGWQPAPTITSKFRQARWHSGKQMTIQEGAILQTFPADYQFIGDKKEQAQQIGNAIPPLLAKALIREAAGI